LATAVPVFHFNSTNYTSNAEDLINLPCEPIQHVKQNYHHKPSTTAQLRLQDNYFKTPLASHHIERLNQ